MKRKFGFGRRKDEDGTSSALRSNGTDNSSAARTTVSSTLSSTLSVSHYIVVERPIIAPHIIQELRLACAQIVQETGPSGAEYEEILNAPDPLQKYKSEVRDNTTSSKPRDRAALAQAATSSHAPHRPQNALRDTSANAAPRPAKDNAKFVANANVEAYPNLRTPAVGLMNGRISSTSFLFNNPSQAPNFEPIEPTHTTASAGKAASDNRESLSEHGTRNHKRETSDQALASIRAELDSRPKTSAAACVDYKASAKDAASAHTSSSTSRSNTTFDPLHKVGTGMTSFVQTPQHEEPNLNTYPADEEESAEANAAAKAWMTMELARRQRQLDAQAQVQAQARQELSAFPALNRPQSRASTRDIPERPQSRAGSIRDGIRDYIRPRPSMESTRDSSRQRSSSRSSSRPGSRAGESTTSGRGSWWKGATNGLRRKGSWSSFRSNRVDDDDRDDRRGRDGGPDLNRSLPPLPGLDQYKEKKETKMHISQLMARSLKAPPPPNTKQQSTPAIRPIASPGLSSNPYMPHDSDVPAPISPLTPPSQFSGRRTNNHLAHVARPEALTKAASYPTGSTVSLPPNARPSATTMQSNHSPNLTSASTSTELHRPQPAFQASTSRSGTPNSARWEYMFADKFPVTGGRNADYDVGDRDSSSQRRKNTQSTVDYDNDVDDSAAPAPHIPTIPRSKQQQQRSDTNSTSASAATVNRTQTQPSSTTSWPKREQSAYALQSARAVGMAPREDIRDQLARERERDRQRAETFGQSYHHQSTPPQQHPPRQHILHQHSSHSHHQQQFGSGSGSGGGGGGIGGGLSRWGFGGHERKKSGSVDDSAVGLNGRGHANEDAGAAASPEKKKGSGFKGRFSHFIGSTARAERRAREEAEARMMSSAPGRMGVVS